MTTRTDRRRHGSGNAPKLLALGALAFVALLAPGLLTQAATSAGQLLGSFAVALAEMLHRTVLQPLLEGLANSINSAPPPAPGP